jgi:hypothetical protein
MVVLEDGFAAQLSVNECEYCVDGNGNWKTLPAATNTETINTGHTLSFRGNLTPASYEGIGTFTLSKSCNLEGNCMSMLFGDDAASNTSLSGKVWAFYKLFYNCTTIKSISSGFLPATTLVYACYDSMFYGCTSLVNAPELPATTLSNSCYDSMFYGCTSLVNAPELPATTLASYCYSSMFCGCINLTTAPELPATTLANNCYNSMFQNCTNLTTAPALPATTLAERCYENMFFGCSGLRTAPELPATTLARNCYWSMFESCTKLNYIKAMFTTTPSTTYTYKWVKGVASTGKFMKNKNATWNVTATSTNDYIGIPSGWTVELVVGYTVNLNNQWRLSSNISNPNSSLYDGVYESYSNYNVNNGTATMTINITGYTSFSVYIRSYAESNYDYVMISQLDKTITGSTSYSSSDVKAHTRGSQQSGTAISNYKLVEYTNIDGGNHTITIVYRKDSSSHSGDDRGYVLIPK